MHGTSLAEDAIGEWHDSEELVAIAADVLEEGNQGCAAIEENHREEV